MGVWTKASSSSSSARLGRERARRARGARTGVPVLVAFLVLGMLLGLGRAASSSTTPSWRARSGSSAWPSSLRGRPQTSWRRLRAVAGPAAVLSTLGVVVTALLVGVAAQALFDLSWSSRSSRSSRRRRTPQRVRHAPVHAHSSTLARTLEAESAATTRWRSPDARPDRMDREPGHVDREPRALVVRQLALGLLVGVASAGHLDLRAPAALARTVRTRRVACGGGDLCWRT